MPLTAIKYKEKMLAKDSNKNIKIKAIINPNSKRFLDIHVFTNVIAEVDDYNAIWKFLNPMHLKNVAKSITKSDSYLFELKYITLPQSAGEPPKTFPVGRELPIVYGFTFEGNKKWRDIKDNVDWQDYVEEEASWYIDDILKIKEFKGIKGLYKLEAGKIGDYRFYKW